MRRFATILLVLFLLPFSAFALCTSDQIDVLGDGTQCETNKFNLTTTSDTTSLIFTMSATGTFYVDCGDGGTLSQDTSDYGTISGNIIDRTSTDITTYTCTWQSAGAHNVKFGGTATGYSTSTSTAAISFYQSSNGTQTKIASIDGSLGAMLPVVNGAIPRFYQTFYGCTNLTSIPSGLFSSIDTSSVTDTSYIFSYTFYECSGITSIPSGLFSSIDTSSATNTSYMFYYTFYGCTGLTSIPSGLFSSIDTSSATNTSYMFDYTFRGCTNLTGIPSGLFSSIDTSSATNTSYMFYYAFYGCTNLTGIPSGLFSSIDTSSATNTNSMFAYTFYGCTGLTSIPSGLFSTIDTSSATDTMNMFAYTFAECTGLTSIPSGLFSTIDTSSATNTTYMFRGTFQNCSNLTGYIPPTTFPSTIVARSSNSSYMWSSTFNGTQLATSCPSGTEQYTTGFESQWGYSNYNTSTDGTNRVSCGCQLGQYGDGETCSACANTKPTNSSWQTSTDANCVWTCDDGYGLDNGACTSCAAGEFTANDTCQTKKFELTTTSDTTSLIFTMSATGTFYVNCGDGGTLSQSGTTTGSTISGKTITRTTDTSVTTYTCTWQSAGTHNVKFGGTATGYNTGTTTAAIAFNNGCSKIASIDGDLSAIFPTLANNTSPRFYRTFAGCSNITSIPPYLFSGLTSANPSMFRQTFLSCTNLSGYIPPSTFAGLIANGHPTASAMWFNTFGGTALATSCPSGTEQYITGYEGSNTSTQWGGRVSCEPCTLGTYSDGTTTCTACTNKPANSSYTGNAGTNSCPYVCDTGYYGDACNACTNKPSNSTYTGTAATNACPWTCDTNYTEYSNTCHAMCPGAKTTLHSGTYSYPMFADKTNVPSPVLHIKENDTTCYVYLEADTGGEHGLKVLYNNITYHAIDPR